MKFDDKTIYDSGILISASYIYKDHERYDLNNGNSYLLKMPFTSCGVNQGAFIKIFKDQDKLVADWGNIPLMEVEALHK
jgi:hypothetical protein